MATHQFEVEALGIAKYVSPIKDYAGLQRPPQHLLIDPHLENFLNAQKSHSLPESFEIASPSPKIFFDPPRTRAAIVTCGGLCPGINAVIRALVMQLWYRYTVRSITGIKFGYQGLSTDNEDDFIDLTPDAVMNIHEQGGTILGSSRGNPPVEVMAQTLKNNNFNILFVIGGDGTMRGALAIHEAAKKIGYEIAIVGVPKTIDNDIPYVRRSFGFETAVSVACDAVRTAHIEARGFKNGIGLVKLMGRHSGYIAANTTLATGHANYCLIPEVPFSLEGKGGLLDSLTERFTYADHAVIVVAEGAGQQYFDASKAERDPSGNIKLGDIGLFLKDEIGRHFTKLKMAHALKYVDPSYIIRAAPANPADALFSGRLAQNAVHAAMAGKTALIVGYWHGRMTYVPMKALGQKRQAIKPEGDLWFNVLETTGQPVSLMGQS